MCPSSIRLSTLFKGTGCVCSLLSDMRALYVLITPLLPEGEGGKDNSVACMHAYSGSLHVSGLIHQQLVKQILPILQKCSCT
jgi:hypothetical protein